MTTRSLPVLIACVLFFAPYAASAASLSLIPSAAGISQEFPIAVRLVPEGAHVNVVEGSLAIPDGLTVTRVSTGGSALMLWPVTPSFSRESHTVSFTGGVAGAGLPADSDSLLLTVYVRAGTPGTYVVTPAAFSGYSADGTGTRIPVTIAPISVVVGPASANVSVPADHAAPENVTAVLGNDASLFGGKPFIFFYGHDEGTGIATFEAKEGWFGSYTIADRYYVPHTATAPVWIRATDEAGNARTVHVPGTGGITYRAVQAAPYAVAVLLLLALGAWFMRRRR